MEVKLDSKWRIVIPKWVRQLYNLDQDTICSIEQFDKHSVILKFSQKPTLCPDCNSPILDINSKFCNNCGNKIKKG